jgi:dTMP kinase
MLVVLEGLDGSGKTTIANVLAKEMSRKNQPVIVKSFEKDESSHCVQKLGRAFSHESRFFLQIACFLHAYKEIDSLLSSGKVVIADRYIYSIIAYYNAAKGNLPHLSMSDVKYKHPTLKILLCCNSKDRKIRVLSRSCSTSQRKLSIFEKYGSSIKEEYDKLGPWLKIRTDEIEEKEVVDLIISEIEDEKKRTSYICG